jgi:hypothetical protein
MRLIRYWGFRGSSRKFEDFVFPSREVALVEFEVALTDLQFLDLGIKS